MEGPVHQKSEHNMSSPYSAAPSAPMLPQQSPPTLSNNYMPYHPLNNLPPNPSNPIFQEVDPQLAPPTQAPTTSNNNGSKSHGETKARLRKACDSCSVRKVKCDEQQPCKACEGLQIPCTFQRPSKRRGPPNKHAESLKRKYDSPDGPAMNPPHLSSPTHAAHTLAYFSQQQVLSAETICPITMLERLVDDYFTFIHPRVPLPHEQFFRDALRRRQDLHNPNFVALIASMLGYLVACYPQRPRQHIREGLPMEHQQQMETLYSNPMDLVDRCQKIAMEALGPAYLARKMSVDDAVIGYLQALTCLQKHDQIQDQTDDRESAIRYLRIFATVGLYKVDATNSTHINGHALPAARMTANGNALMGPNPAGVDQVMREMGKRAFWALFAEVRSLQQAGVSQSELFVPPATPSEPYLPLPAEIDDAYIMPDQFHLNLQQEGDIPVITGFNANVRVLSTCNDIAVIELVHKFGEFADWERQKKVMYASLQSVKNSLNDLPSQLVYTSQAPVLESREPRYPSPNPESSLEQELVQHASNGTHNIRIDFNRPRERRRIQYEIQKAHLYATQLVTRLYLVEKYLNAYDAYSLARSDGGNSDRAPSPGIIAPILDKYDSSNSPGTTEQDLAAEREDIIKAFLALLSQVNEISLEILGNVFLGEIIHLARVVLDAPHARQGHLAQASETYLRASLLVLEKLDKITPTGNWITDEGELGQLWTTLRGYQASFAQSGVLGGDV